MGASLGSFDHAKGGILGMAVFDDQLYDWKRNGTPAG